MAVLAGLQPAARAVSQVFINDDDQHNLRAADCGQIVIRDCHDKSKHSEDPIYIEHPICP
jgi:hypothetical protein